MAVLSNKIIEILKQPETLKSIATVSREGIPHVAYKGTLRAFEDTLIYYDLIQSSQTNKNLVHAIWFEKKVAINLLSKDRRSFLIIGTPEKCVTCGKEFEQVYEQIRSGRGDVDLNAIWYIKPESIKEQTFAVRFREEEEKYPVIKHIDRLLKPEYQ